MQQQYVAVVWRSASDQLLVGPWTSKQAIVDAYAIDGNHIAQRGEFANLRVFACPLHPTSRANPSLAA